MKIIHENILGFLKIKICLVCLFFIQANVAAQENPVADTAIISESDSSASTEQTDTEYEKPKYFDDKVALTDSIELRQVPGRIVDSLKKDDAFWYADHVFEKKQKETKDFKVSKPSGQWLNLTILMIVVVIFLGILLWYLFQNNIIRRNRTILSGQKEKDAVEENIFEINYQREIEKAITAGDYRFAIRLMFLRLLKDLSLKKIIQYKQERTNFDYLSQLYSTAYYNHFFRLTRNYEYTWYGKFEVSSEAFAGIKNDFENFDHKLP